MKCEKNIGPVDATLRIIVGAFLVAGFFMNLVAEPLSYLALLVGIVLLITAAIGKCCLYSILRINTGKKK